MVLCDAHGTGFSRHGRVLERSRFRGPAGSERAREHAFQQLGLAESGPPDEMSFLNWNLKWTQTFPTFVPSCSL